MKQQDQLIYGLDIGGTKIEIGIFSNQLELIDSWRVSTPTQSYPQFVNAIVSLVEQANEKYSSKGIVGLGMPGIIDEQGIAKSANVPCATGRDIVHDLNAKLGGHLAIGNDCRLFALSESVGGAGEHYQRVFGAIIGTGAAGGLCIDGQLYQGRRGVAGEYGHVGIAAHLIEKYQLPIRECGCGLTGCYESYVSGPGLGWLYHHFGAASQDTREFVKQLAMGDDIANKTYHCYMDLLGASFASIVLAYDPDVIVVGGGISKIPPVVEALQHFVDRHLFANASCPPIKVARFGDSSGVRGAAILRKQLAETGE